MSSERFKQGLEKRRSVLGDAYVDGVLARASKFTQPFQELVTESVWGHIWSRGTLDDRTRNLINVALMVAMDRPNELKLYIKARKGTGASLEDIAEVILHTTVYCGVPAALEAFKEFDLVLAEEAGTPSA
ncbi:MAG: carboxymuconolactone decarboxylase family protein [Pseudomonadota bacterium]